MRIALIHCPLGHRSFSENLKVVDEEFCLAPPIVLAYVAAILEKAGHSVIIIDANAFNLTKEKTLKILRNFAPDIIGFRSDSYWFHRVVEWATYFKNRMDATIITGGINISLYPKESLSYTCFDYGIAGEAVESLPQLLTALKWHEKPDHIKGIVYRNGDEVRANPAPEKLANFDDYPFPARHLLPNYRYSSFASQRKNYTIMLTSTGCPYGCSFCAISRIPYRERSVKNVMDEIQECYHKYGIREFDFFDATFFINKDKSMEICEEILKRDIRIEWSCRSRVDVIDKELLRNSFRSGCRKIYYGIESTSAEVLKTINKNIDYEQIARAIELTRDCGIATLGFFMLGNPGDTAESVMSMIDFAKKIKLDYVQVCRTIAKPNTELNDQLIRKYGVDFWKQYILEEKSFQRLPSPWTTLSEDEIDKLMRKFYKSFYFRFSILVKRVLKLKSMDEFVRYAKVAAKWFICNQRDGV